MDTPAQNQAKAMKPDPTLFDDAARQVVELANQLAEENPDVDVWDIADGIMAGAVHYWLYSRQPCEDPMCADCAPTSTAELRKTELLKNVKLSAEESDYFHAPTDSNAAWA
ncbi:MAG: hypothetical protein ACHQAZ_02685 [Gammaproteobacteria bacterium]|jgi:hypothetical protein|nr:hypothetical protein [Gammaproteobacteria bacterium]